MYHLSCLDNVIQAVNSIMTTLWCPLLLYLSKVLYIRGLYLCTLGQCLFALNFLYLTDVGTCVNIKLKKGCQ